MLCLSMARHTTEVDLAIRQRWSGWLSQYVGESKSISVEELGTAIFPKGRGSWLIYDWLECERAVTPAKAFQVGEALHALVARLFSGAIALFAAGYLAEFVYALADLARRGFTVDAAILALRAGEAVDDIGDARDMLATVIRPERYEESDLRDPQVDAAFRIAAAVARESRNLSFEIRESRVASEVRSMMDRRPELWRDKRLRAIRLAGSELSPKSKARWR